MILGERVAALSDLAAVAVCEELATALLARTDVALEDVELPALLTSDEDFATLRAGLDRHYYMALPPDVSVPLARSLLAAAADDLVLAPVLTRVLDDHRDTKQFVLEVLSIGAAISMVILAATTTYENGRLGKKELTPEQAKEIAGCLNALKPWAARFNG
jgi:hypothetical protein